MRRRVGLGCPDRRKSKTGWQDGQDEPIERTGGSGLVVHEEIEMHQQPQFLLSLIVHSGDLINYSARVVILSILPILSWFDPVHPVV
jgi:hypothetical protein